jgi:hypothetical protein
MKREATPPSEMEISPLQEGRWKVRSRSDPDIDYLVKFWGEKKSYSCNCAWGINGQERTKSYCAHIKETKRRYAPETLDDLRLYEKLDEAKSYIPNSVVWWEGRLGAIAVTVGDKVVSFGRTEVRA